MGTCATNHPSPSGARRSAAGPAAISGACRVSGHTRISAATAIRSAPSCTAGSAETSLTPPPYILAFLPRCLVAYSAGSFLMGHFHRLPAALLAGLLASVPVVAAAQIAPSIDARTWSPSMDPGAGLVLEPTQSPGPWQWNVGAWMSYAQSPVLLRFASSNDVAYRPLDHALGVDLVAGIGLGDRAAIGVDVPVLLFQDGTSGLPGSIVSGGRVPAGGIGDVAILGKGTLLRNDPHGVPLGFGLSALAGVTLPTGDRASFAGDGSTTVSLRLLAEYALGLGAIRASAGYSLRTAQQAWPADASLGGVTFGDAIPWSLGLTLRPKTFAPSLDQDDRQSWEVALHGWLPAGPVAPFGAGAPELSPALLAASDRIELGHYRDAFVLVGVDIGLDQAVGVPDVPRRARHRLDAARARPRRRRHPRRSTTSAPTSPRTRTASRTRRLPRGRRDGDGILDDEDACPDVPGRLAERSEEERLPAPDTDGDGIPDAGRRVPRREGRAPTTTRRRTAAPPSATATATASPTTPTSAPTRPRTRTASRTSTAAPTRTTTATASPTRRTPAPTRRASPRRIRRATGARTPTATATRTTTTSTSAPTRPRSSTA